MAGVAALTCPLPPRAASLATSPSWTPSPLPCGSSCFLPTWLSAVSCFWLPGEWTGEGVGRGRSPAHQPPTPALSLFCWLNTVGHRCPVPALSPFLIFPPGDLTGPLSFLSLLLSSYLHCRVYSCGVSASLFPAPLPLPFSSQKLYYLLQPLLSLIHPLVSPQAEPL